MITGVSKAKEPPSKVGKASCWGTLSVKSSAGGGAEKDGLISAVIYKEWVKVSV